MTARNASTRQMRLECIKVAANVVCQMKDPKISVIEQAKAYMTFIDQKGDEVEADDDDEARGANERSRRFG
jgi:hypothetical protein